MKKPKRGKDKAARSTDVLLLKDLSPVDEVRGGSAKRVFGQRTTTEERKRTPKGAKDKKAPKV